MVTRLQYLRFCLFEMYVNVVFVIRCLYSAVSLTDSVKEQCFIIIIIIIIIIYWNVSASGLYAHSLILILLTKNVINGAHTLNAYFRRKFLCSD